MKRFLLLLLLGLFIGAMIWIQGPSFSRFWKRMLIVSLPMEKADALIVLGGEPLARPSEAARLFHEGVSKKIFVTGVGDAARNRQVLLGAGVPGNAIVVESHANTTFANASLLKPLLEKAHVHTALIVTSPFHTRRALATFRKVLPSISFGVTEASINWWKTPQGAREENRFALLEFIKIAEYRLLYGVSSFPNR